MLKIIKQNIVVFLFVFGALFSSKAQTLLRDEIAPNGASNSMAFIDGSSNAGYSAPGANYVGKGILFPRMDLTLDKLLYDTGSIGNGSYNPNYYDGLVVYNTGTGTSTVVGSEIEVSPGFYYFSNPETPTDLTSGTWTAIGGGGSGAFNIVENTPTDTSIINTSADQEKVIQLVGSATGDSAEIDLGLVNLSENTVKQFRKAYIYETGTGALILTATSDYDSATNVFVTGNGMMNVVLEVGDYNVELYYTAN